MSKTKKSLFGISLSLILILFSIPPVSAISEELEFTIVSKGWQDSPFSVATDSEDKIFVAVPFLNSIYIYDDDGNLLSTIDVGTTIMPISISIDTNNRIIIVDGSSAKVLVFNPDGNWLFNVDYSFGNPARITTDSNNRIIVVDIDTNRTHIFDANGNHEFTIVPPINPLAHLYEDEEYKIPTGLPTGVATDSNDRIIISDYGNRQINIYDSQGNFEFSIDEAIPEIAPFVSPLSVTTDSKDRIIVIDSNTELTSGKHAVFIYDSDGTFLHTISYGVTQLSNLTTDSNDRIIVIDRLNKVVRVYSMDYPPPVGNGGGCSGDCTPPTLGVDSNNRQRVNDGISINGFAKDGGYYHTEYPMQFTQIGQTNNIALKYYENGGAHNIQLVQLGIGIREIGTPINNSEALIEVWMDNFSDDIDNPTIKEAIIIDPDHILGNISVSTSLVSCGASAGNSANVSYTTDFNDKDTQADTINSTCLRVNFQYSYAKVPQSAVLGSNAMDYQRNTFNNYFNDGLTVIDPTPIVEQVQEPEPQEICHIKNVPERYDCFFESMVQYEIRRAQQYYPDYTNNEIFDYFASNSVYPTPLIDEN
jgi:sugar lactone lactonase YvrE